MAFKQNPDKKPRWDELSKAALIKTVKTLSARQTKLLNQIVKLEDQVNLLEAEIDTAPSLDTKADTAASLPAVEFGYRAGEKGVDNLEMTLHKWTNPTGVHLDDMLERNAPRPGKGQLVGLPFPWEVKS